MSAKVRPKVFIGSSSEAREIVGRILTAIGHCSISEPWWASPAFEQENTTIEGLLTAVMSYDHAVFLLSGDDLITSRKTTLLTARDNVVFEIGLFIGQLGRDRVTIIAQQSRDGPDLKIPVDLAGVTMPRIKPTVETAIAEIEKVAPEICRRIQKSGLRHFAFTLKQSWDYDTEAHAFVLEIDRTRLQRNRLLIGERPLALAIRKRGGRQGFDKSPIVIGDIRSFSAEEIEMGGGEEVLLHAGTENCLGKLRPGDVVEGYLLLVSRDQEEVAIRDCKTLAEMFTLGCRMIDTAGCEIGDMGK